MNRMIRQTVLVVALALFALLPTRLVNAAEPLPSGAAVDEADRKKIETYRAISTRALKDVLTPLVDKAAVGREFPGPRWERQCADVLAALGALKKQGAVPESLNKWFAAEWAAWTNVRTIGREMLDTHYRMAYDLELIEQDTKDCIAFVKYVKDQLSRTNEKAGRLDTVIDSLSKVEKSYEKVSGLASNFATAMDVLETNAQFVSKVLLKFRTKSFAFIKEKDLTVTYRDSLAKLKSRSIDPDQSGVFVTFEKDWEETMYATYARYQRAVEDWKKANRVFSTKDEFLHFMKENLSKVVEIGTEKAFQLPFSPMGFDDLEKLEKWCFRAKEVFRKAMEVAKQYEWARIDSELRDWQERRQDANMAYDEQVREAEKESERLARVEIEKRIDVEEASAAKIARLADELEDADADLTDEGTRAAAMERIRRIQRQIETEERARDKAFRYHDDQIRYYRNAWQRKQEDEAYEKLQKAVEEIDKEERKLRDERPR